MSYCGMPADLPLLEEVLVLIHEAGDDALEAAHGRVHAQHDEHEEEYHRPEQQALRKEVSRSRTRRLEKHE